MAICWGDNRVFLYNDAWQQLFGRQEVPASGSPVQDIYGEQWQSMEPVFDKFVVSAESIQCDRHLFGDQHRGRHGGHFNYMLQPLYAENEHGVLIVAERSFEEIETSHDDFVATLAHELRNPLGALSAAAQVLNRAVDRPQMMATAREALTRQVGHLAQLLDDLLTISRLQRGRLQLHCQPVALQTVIDAAIAASQAAMEVKQHSLTLEVPETTLYISGDKLLLVRIFSTLLNLVADHIGTGRLLQLQVKPHEPGVDVVIRNTAFAPQLIQRLIKDFLERKFTRQLGKDADIGLYLVCGLIQLHGGEISVHSNVNGDGSDIVVCLPRSITDSIVR